MLSQLSKALEGKKTYLAMTVVALIAANQALRAGGYSCLPEGVEAVILSLAAALGFYGRAAAKVAIAVVFLIGSASHAQERVATFKTTPNLQYGADVKYQSLDLYVPETPALPTAVIFVHGGKWESGDKSQYAGIGQYFASQGVACAVINYRLAPYVNVYDQASDVARSVTWLRSYFYAEKREPQIVLMGFSAGAHLASLVAVDPSYLGMFGLNQSALKSCVAIGGVYRALPVRFLSAFAWTGCDASPINIVSPAAPRFLIVYAQHDLPLLPWQAHRFRAAVSVNGKPNLLMMALGVDHAGLMTQFASYAPEVLKFVRS